MFCCPTATVDHIELRYSTKYYSPPPTLSLLLTTLSSTPMIPLTITTTTPLYLLAVKREKSKETSNYFWGGVYIIIIIGSHWAGNASHCPQRHSPTRRLAGRRHALRPAFRLREPPRAGAARRAHLHHPDHLLQEPLAGTLQITCHFLTTPHTHTFPAMPKHTPSHLSLTHAQTACTHPRASRAHPADPLRVRILLPASDCV